MNGVVWLLRDTLEIERMRGYGDDQEKEGMPPAQQVQPIPRKAFRCTYAG
jgi:hypothetical protein